MRIIIILVHVLLRIIPTGASIWAVYDHGHCVRDIFDQNFYISYVAFISIFALISYLEKTGLIEFKRDRDKEIYEVLENYIVPAVSSIIVVIYYIPMFLDKPLLLKLVLGTIIFFVSFGLHYIINTILSVKIKQQQV